jgi:hypothetical protein
VPTVKLVFVDTRSTVHLSFQLTYMYVIIPNDNPEFFRALKQSSGPAGVRSSRGAEPRNVVSESFLLGGDGGSD